MVWTVLKPVLQYQDFFFFFLILKESKINVLHIKEMSCNKAYMDDMAAVQEH